MTAAPTTTKVERMLDQRSKLAIAASGIAVADLACDCIDAAVDAVMSRYDLPWDEVAFGVIEREVRADVPELASDALATAADVLAAAGRVRKRAAALTAPAAQPTIADALAHLDRLVAPGFVRRAGTARLPDVHRYVRGIEYRLDHLAGDLARDQRRIAEVRPIEQEYAAVVAAMERVPDAVRDVAWMIEEYRMSVFAQPLGVQGPVSPKRIRQLLTRR
jgi:ATP-dependent helicase HrpA